MNAVILLILLCHWDQKHPWNLKSREISASLFYQPASQWSLSQSWSVTTFHSFFMIALPTSLTFANSLRNPIFLPFCNVFIMVYKAQIHILNLLTQYFFNIFCQTSWCPASKRPSQGKVGLMSSKLVSLAILGPVYHWIILFPFR